MEFYVLPGSLPTCPVSGHRLGAGDSCTRSHMNCNMTIWLFFFKDALQMYPQNIINKSVVMTLQPKLYVLCALPLSWLFWLQLVDAAECLNPWLDLILIFLTSHPQTSSNAEKVQKVDLFLPLPNLPLYILWQLVFFLENATFFTKYLSALNVSGN